MDSDALKRLIKAVEAGAYDAMVARFNRFAEAWEEAFGTYTGPNYDTGFRAYCGSLDAAKDLHEALLPGWRYKLHNWGKVELETEARGEVHPLNYLGGFSRNNPARGWLHGILRAKLSEAENHPRQETSD